MCCVAVLPFCAGCGGVLARDGGPVIGLVSETSIDCLWFVQATVHSVSLAEISWSILKHWAQQSLVRYLCDFAAELLLRIV